MTHPRPVQSMPPRSIARAARRLAGAAAATVMLHAAGAAAQAVQSATIAEALFREGQRLMQDGQTAAACEKFAASHKMEPALGTLLNLAVCHEKQGKTATAWTEFGEVIAMARRAGDMAREQFARRRYDALEKAIHRVVIEVLRPSPGTEIVLDGNVLDRAAWGTGIPLDPGEHTIEVTAPGKKRWTRMINLGPSSSIDRIEVPALEDEDGEGAAAVRDEPEAAPLEPTEPSQPTAEPPRGQDTTGDAGESTAPADTQRALGYGIGAAGVVGLGAAGYFALSSRSHGRQRDEICPPGVPCLSQEALDADHSARVAQRWMLVTGGLGAAAVAAGVVLIVTSGGSQDQQTARLQVAPLAAPSGGGVELSGVW